MKQGYEITGAELVDLVGSAQFRSRLARAARITARTGHESAFAIFRKLGTHAQTYFMPVLEGMTSEASEPGSYIKWKQAHLPGWPERNFYATLLDVHFHPEYEEPLALSIDDVLLMDRSLPDLDDRPIIAIGSVNDTLTGCMLLLQRTFSGSLRTKGRSLAAQLMDRALDFRDRALSGWTTESFATFLAIPGYIRRAVFSFQVSTDSRPALVQNPQVLADFGYCVRARSLEEDLFS